MIMNSVDLNNLIDTNLADNSDIKPSEHREVEQEIVNAVFGEILVYSNTVTGVLYNITFEKRGSLCYVSGTIKNNNSYITGISLTIPDAIYYSLVDTYIDATRWINGYTTSCIASNDKINLATSLGVSHEIYINGFYKILE